VTGFPGEPVASLRSLPQDGDTSDELAMDRNIAPQQDAEGVIEIGTAVQVTRRKGDAQLADT
jgi:hypothetical protein